LLLHHDALRLRFERTSLVGSSFPVLIQSAIYICGFSALAEAEQGPAIEAAATELQTSLNLSTGPLMRVALFDLGVHVPRRLLLIIHHLVVDGVLANFARGLADSLPTAQQRDDATACQDNFVPALVPRAGVCTFSTTAATVLAGPVPEARWNPPASGLSGGNNSCFNSTDIHSVWKRPKPYYRRCRKPITPRSTMCC